MIRYTLDARCPACGTPPAINAYEATLDAVRDLPPDTPLHRYRCHLQYCETKYDLTASAYQGARPTDPNAPVVQPPPVRDRRLFREELAKRVYADLIGRPEIAQLRKRGLVPKLRATSGALRFQALSRDRNVDVEESIERPEWWRPGTDRHATELADELAARLRGRA